MPRYITIQRGDISYKRRVLTKKEQRARLDKFRASMRAKMDAKRNGHATTTTEAKAKPAKPPPNGNGTTVQANGTDAEAARLKARTEAALIHLRRGADWLEKAGPSVRDFDTAHGEMLNAYRELVGK
jgi:hypothetical protein